MNKHFVKVVLAISLFVVSIGFVGCGVFRPSVRLPHDYKLEQRGRIVFLLKPDGTVLCPDSITDFTAKGDVVYGLISLDPPQYFFLDTKSGQFERFVARRDFDLFVKRKGLPEFNWSFSHTFWDLTSGQRKLGD